MLNSLFSTISGFHIFVQHLLKSKSIYHYCFGFCIINIMIFGSSHIHAYTFSQQGIIALVDLGFLAYIHIHTCEVKYNPPIPYLIMYYKLYIIFELGWHSGVALPKRRTRRSPRALSRLGRQNIRLLIFFVHNKI